MVYPVIECLCSDVCNGTCEMYSYGETRATVCGTGRLCRFVVRRCARGQKAWEVSQCYGPIGQRNKAKECKFQTIRDMQSGFFNCKYFCLIGWIVDVSGGYPKPQGRPSAFQKRCLSYSDSSSNSCYPCGGVKLLFVLR